MKNSVSRYIFTETDIKGIDYIECPICGFKCKKITGGHLKSRHGITIKEFRIDFPNYPTECESHIKFKSESEKSYMSDASFRKKRSDYIKAIWENEEIRNKRTDSVRKHHSSLSFREDCRIHSTEVWKDEKTRSRLISNMLKANKNPEVKRHRSEAMLKNWESEEFKNKVFNNPSRSTEYITCDGVTLYLKSTYEVRCCTLLDNLGIRYQYEPKRFHYYFEGAHHSYYPDFYLKDFDLYLEVKPKVFTTDEVNIVKLNSVRYKKCNITFITEDDLITEEILFNTIQTSTTIP